jgi:membrane-bound lytic murein transglycosylase D
VRYLKTLHGMFAGDWRLAVMAYNAGEYRVLGALRRSRHERASARPAELPAWPASPTPMCASCTPCPA